MDLAQGVEFMLLRTLCLIYHGNSSAVELTPP